MADDRDVLPGAPDWRPGDPIPDGWLAYTCPGEGHDEPFEFLTPEVLTGDESCPICDHPIGARWSDGDEPQGIASEACAAALARAEEVAVERGHSMLAGFTMGLFAPADAPEGEARARAGMWAMTDAEKGPSDPHEFLDFLLAGAAAFAERQGIPLARFEMPPNRGQG
jgi:hypothetical protein